MPAIGSKTRTIRFNASDLGIIEDLMKKENVSFNNAVHLLMERGGTPQNQSKSVKGTPQNEEKTAVGVHPETKKVSTPIPKTDYESISEMASLMRVSEEKILKDIKDLLESGELYYSNGTLRNARYEEFENICEAKKQDIDKVLMKIIREMA